MQYRFVHMTEEYASEVVDNWHYEGVYSFYDMAADEEDLRIFTDRAYWENTTFAVLNPEDDLVGWATFYMEGGDMWLSLGLKPRLTGQGLGQEFVSRCVEFARSHYKLDEQVIKLDVADFNKRAIKVYERAGFAETGRITKKTHLGEVEFLRMSLPLVPSALATKEFSASRLSRVVYSPDGRQEEASMPEMADYSGPFDPGFSHDKLNKDTLLRLLRTYNEYMLRIDGFWYLNVMKKWGNDEAFDCDVRVWEKAQLWEMKAISTALNISGDDVATVFKYCQVSPWMHIYTAVMDLRDRDHGVITITHCPTLIALEKEGTGREKLICQELEPKLMAIQAHYFNPQIEVIGVKQPPRTSYSDCCCQWEYRLDR